MAILVDISQIIIANIAMAQFVGRRDGTVVDDALIKHMIINSLRLYNVKFKKDYGQLIICCDTRNTWRKEIFPFYKAKRQEQKESGSVDWKVVYSALNGMIDDLKQHFPYKVIKVDGCEADDILASLSRNIEGNHVIISGDKDMGQLINDRVKQFHPISKKFIEIANPRAYLKELIIRGDKGDGVPNILSDDDSIVTNGKRQKSIHDSKVQVWLNKEPKEFCEDNKVLNNYMRNMTLIDLRCTPAELQNAIWEEYEKPANGNTQTIIQYFSAHRMRNLLESIEQF